MCCFSLNSSVKVLAVLQNGQVKSFLCALTDGRGLETDWRGWPTCRRTRSSPRIVASKFSEVLLALKTTSVSSGNLMPHTAREAKGSFCKASTRGAVRGPEIGFTRPIVRRVNRQILSLEKLHTPQPLCLPACTCVHSHYFLPTWTYQWTIKRNEILYWLIYCVTIKQVGLHAFPPVNANQSMYHNPIFFPKSVWEIYFSLKLSQI